MTAHSENGDSPASSQRCWVQEDGRASERERAVRWRARVIPARLQRLRATDGRADADGRKDCSATDDKHQISP